MILLDRGDAWAAFFKPSGFHVHPPENTEFRVPRDKIFLYAARRFMKTHVYPVHRLDAGTCGVLLMALDPQTAAFLARQFQNRDVEKTYHAVVRGWPADAGRVDLPLELDSTGEPAESLTLYRTLSRLEIPQPVGRRHPTARYSLLELEPKTGRFHQIRRHMNRISHPVLGDAMHGDSHHNRFFREKMGVGGLCLKSHALGFTAPEGPRRLRAPDDDKWSRVREMFRNPLRPE
ncbi:MAG: tRNA pseudouridine(65) synthase TruC [Bdellovibrionaceae bacterium]|nr:tRNA pseudouridine(65) synthase TruC [Pseudobdellovibrionaceae bacterium]MBX3033201.1 tRNA pseudouridine(65) synthase TruC [Pseudobdellovibrionaceae bacterium]